MKRVLFIQNGEEDGPGLLAKVLANHQIPLDTVHAWRGDRVPISLNGYSGLCVGGGSMSAFQTKEYPFLALESQLLKQAHALGLPSLGFCLGAQLMAQSLGGKVFRNHRPEIGFFEVRFRAEAASDPLWKHHHTPFLPTHWHNDTFALPPTAELLASSDITPHQLFRCGPHFYGIQFHLEFDLAIVESMLKSDAELLARAGIDAKELLDHARIHLPLAETVGIQFFGTWAQNLR
jgi:GMP synthase (glutamine-hydrolysing)